MNLSGLGKPRFLQHLHSSEVTLKEKHFIICEADRLSSNILGREFGGNYLLLPFKRILKRKSFHFSSRFWYRLSGTFYFILQQGLLRNSYPSLFTRCSCAPVIYCQDTERFFSPLFRLPKNKCFLH